MKTHIRMLAGVLAATLAVLLAAMLGWSSQAQAHTRASASPPPADTIVRVVGDATNGYAIRHYDRSWRFAPPQSRALTACAHDDTRVARVRCRTEVRTWYRDLADAQQALAWARRRG